MKCDFCKSECKNTFHCPDYNDNVCVKCCEKCYNSDPFPCQHYEKLLKDVNDVVR